MTHYILAPSLLSANLANLGQAAEEVLVAGANWLHLDVMDNHYVPNLTFGPLVCQALREYGIEHPLNVHLMTTEADRLVRNFAAAGASHIVVHPNGTTHLDRTLDLIHDCGLLAGIALNPSDSEHLLRWILPKVDMIFLMAVNPGFGGQTFIPYIIEKIGTVQQYLQHHAKVVPLFVDGGITLNNLPELIKAGATGFVVGTSIFQDPNPAHVVQNIKAHFQNSYNFPKDSNTSK